MKKNRIVSLVVIILILVLVAVGSYQYFFKTDATSTLTLAEKQWIEANKNNVVDISIVEDIPVLTSDEEGVFFEFLNSLTTDTKLEFNDIALKDEDKDSDYSFKVTDTRSKNDLLFYQDNYAIFGNKEETYQSLFEMPQMKLGILKKDIAPLKHYFKEAKQFTYQTFDNERELLLAMTDSKLDIDAVVLPKLTYLAKYDSKNELHLNYDVTDFTNDYVLHLGNNKKLNGIIKKYYKKWLKSEYTKSFEKNFDTTFFLVTEEDEKSRSDFHSKSYKYGYISEAPKHLIIDSLKYGYFMKQIETFTSISGIEVEMIEYSSREEMLKAFSENKIDFFYDDTNRKTYDMDVVTTTPANDMDVVIISPRGKDVVVNSLVSLYKKDVATLKDTKIEAALKNEEAIVTSYSSIKELLNKKNKTTVLALDLETFKYYRNSKLSNYVVDYSKIIDGNGYTVRDIKANKVLADYLDFYLTFTEEKTSMNDAIISIQETGNKPYIYKLLVWVAAIIVSILIVLLGIKKYKKFKEEQYVPFKGNKIRYIDSLTSLKNRTYLNENVESWDNSQVYPQAIVIIDLNNVAYINDNYGHQEGDNLIREAANKLILTQIENSEVIRTNGNEFLVYLVGYEEKQVITYIKKLSKELKDISHGYGAAIGYSIINDAIKTIDDAINEATLDMKSNKEELNN